MGYSLRVIGAVMLALILGFEAKAQSESSLLSEDELLKKPLYTNLPQAYRNYDQVYRLALKGSGGYYGKVDEVPSNIDSLLNLQYFYVVNESLQDLPEQFGNLQGMQHLYLSGNRFQTIPDTLFSFQYLKRLDMRNNPLVEIPEKIKRLDQLEFLYLGNNPNLKVLPLDALAELKQLKVLNLENTGVPRAQLLRLKELLPQTQVDF